MSSGTAGSGYWPAGGAVRAGPLLEVGFKVTIRVTSEVGAPEADGDRVRESEGRWGVCLAH